MVSRLTMKQTNASLKLTNHVISNHGKHSNLVFSPLSIHILLGMVEAGSSGPTRSQILGFLSAGSPKELNEFFNHIVSNVLVDGSQIGGPVLTCASGLWVDQGLTLKSAYQHLLHNSYRADSKHADFQNKADEVREEVNAWASNLTNGLMPEILAPTAVNAHTKLILANALYFKGAWAQGHKFNASLTEEREFYLLNGSKVRAPLMSSWKDQYVVAYDGFKVLKLPYEQGTDSQRSFSMCIFLPDARDGLPGLMERVCSESGFINNHLPLKKQGVDECRVPKFKIAFDFQASDLLKSMGLELPFSTGGLTEMVEHSPASDLLVVSAIIQKSFVKVNEEGTEAAVVTVSGVVCTSSRFSEKRKPRLKFVADHPFLFVIREDISGLILFIGHLLNPLA